MIGNAADKKKSLRPSDAARIAGDASWRVRPTACKAQIAGAVLPILPATPRLSKHSGSINLLQSIAPVVIVWLPLFLDRAIICALRRCKAHSLAVPPTFVWPLLSVSLCRSSTPFPGELETSGVLQVLLFLCRPLLLISEGRRWRPKGTSDATVDVVKEDVPFDEPGPLPRREKSTAKSQQQQQQQQQSEGLGAGKRRRREGRTGRRR
jgi:hypothetical protein